MESISVLIPFKANIEFECNKIIKLFNKASKKNNKIIVKLSAVEGAIVVAMDIALSLQTNINDTNIDNSISNSKLNIHIEHVETSYNEMESNVTGNSDLRAKIEISLINKSI